MKMRSWLAVGLLFATPVLVSLPRLNAQDHIPAGRPPQNSPPPNPQQFIQMVSYALGRSVAEDCAAGGLQVDLQALNAGVTDHAQGKAPRWNPEQLDATMRQFAQLIQQRIMTDNQQSGATFLAQNAQQPGVQTTASGLQYKVLQAGQGAAPTLQDDVKCHYRGTFLDGQEFDSSYRRGQPAVFPVSGVIAGWTEALQLMQEGAKYQLFVPAELAYGERGTGGIGPNETLIFEVELLEVVR